MRISGRQSWTRHTDKHRGQGPGRARRASDARKPQVYDAEYTLVSGTGTSAERGRAFRAEPDARIPAWAVEAFYQSVTTPAPNRQRHIDVFI